MRLLKAMMDTKTYTRGNPSRLCILCGNVFDEFLPLNHVWDRTFWRTGEGLRLREYYFITKPNRECPYCGSHERHRSQQLYLSRNLKSPADVLDIAPDRFNKEALKTEGIKVTTLDINRRKRTDLRRSVCDINEPGKFDVVICCHVLEHVRDDRKALSSIYESLKPGGWALIQIPVWSCGATREAASTSPEERELLFGHPDHVRRYGLDFEQRMALAGFRTERILMADWAGGKYDCEYLGLDPCELLFIGHRQ